MIGFFKCIKAISASKRLGLQYSCRMKSSGVVSMLMRPSSLSSSRLWAPRMTVADSALTYGLRWEIVKEEFYGIGEILKNIKILKLLTHQCSVPPSKYTPLKLLNHRTKPVSWGVLAEFQLDMEIGLELQLYHRWSFLLPRRHPKYSRCRFLFLSVCSHCLPK